MPLAVAPYATSNSTSPNIGFAVSHESVELLALDPISMFHATSSPSPILQPRLKASVVTVPSFGGVLKAPQTMFHATYQLASY